MFRYIAVFILFFSYFISTGLSMRALNPSSFEVTGISTKYPASFIFRIETAKSIYYPSSFVIEMPPGYTKTSLDFSVWVKQGSGSFEKRPNNVSMSERMIIQIKMDSIEITQYEIAIQEVINPSGIASTSNFRISTYLGNTLVEACSDFEGIPIAAAGFEYLFSETR